GGAARRQATQRREQDRRKPYPHSSSPRWHEGKIEEMGGGVSASLRGGYCVRPSVRTRAIQCSKLRRLPRSVSSSFQKRSQSSSSGGSSGSVAGRLTPIRPAAGLALAFWAARWRSRSYRLVSGSMYVLLFFRSDSGPAE